MKHLFPKQKIVLLAGGLIVLLMFLFPPWMEFYRNDIGSFSKLSHGHRFLFNQPVSAHPKTTQGVMWETSRLYPRLLIVGVLTFVAFQIAGPKKTSGSNPGNG